MYTAGLKAFSWVESTFYPRILSVSSQMLCDRFQKWTKITSITNKMFFVTPFYLKCIYELVLALIGIVVAVTPAPCECGKG